MNKFLSQSCTPSDDDASLCTASPIDSSINVNNCSEARPLKVLPQLRDGNKISEFDPDDSVTNSFKDQTIPKKFWSLLSEYSPPSTSSSSDDSDCDLSDSSDSSYEDAQDCKQYDSHIQNDPDTQRKHANGQEVNVNSIQHTSELIQFCNKDDTVDSSTNGKMETHVEGIDFIDDNENSDLDPSVNEVSRIQVIAVQTSPNVSAVNDVVSQKHFEVPNLNCDKDQFKNAQVFESEKITMENQTDSDDELEESDGTESTVKEVISRLESEQDDTLSDNGDDTSAHIIAEDTSLRDVAEPADQTSDTFETNANIFIANESSFDVNEISNEDTREPSYNGVASLSSGKRVTSCEENTVSSDTKQHNEEPSNKENTINIRKWLNTATECLSDDHSGPETNHLESNSLIKKNGNDIIEESKHGGALDNLKEGKVYVCSKVHITETDAVKDKVRCKSRKLWDSVALDVCSFNAESFEKKPSNSTFENKVNVHSSNSTLIREEFDTKEIINAEDIEIDSKPSFIYRRNSMSTFGEVSKLPPVTIADINSQSTTVGKVESKNSLKLSKICHPGSSENVSKKSQHILRRPISFINKCFSPSGSKRPPDKPTFRQYIPPVSNSTPSNSFYVSKETSNGVNISNITDISASKTAAVNNAIEIETEKKYKHNDERKLVCSSSIDSCETISNVIVKTEQVSNSNSFVSNLTASDYRTSPIVMTSIANSGQETVSRTLLDSIAFHDTLNINNSSEECQVEDTSSVTSPTLGLDYIDSIPLRLKTSETNVHNFNFWTSLTANATNSWKKKGIFNRSNASTSTSTVISPSKKYTTEFDKQLTGIDEANLHSLDSSLKDKINCSFMTKTKQKQLTSSRNESGATVSNVPTSLSVTTLSSTTTTLTVSKPKLIWSALRSSKLKVNSSVEISSTSHEEYSSSPKKIFLHSSGSKSLDRRIPFRRTTSIDLDSSVHEQSRSNVPFVSSASDKCSSVIKSVTSSFASPTATFTSACTARSYIRPRPPHESLKSGESNKAAMNVSQETSNYLESNSKLDTSCCNEAKSSAVSSLVNSSSLLKSSHTSTPIYMNVPIRNEKVTQKIGAANCDNYGGDSIEQHSIVSNFERCTPIGSTGTAIFGTESDHYSEIFVNGRNLDFSVVDLNETSQFASTPRRSVGKYQYSQENTFTTNSVTPSRCSQLTFSQQPRSSTNTGCTLSGGQHRDNVLETNVSKIPSIIPHHHYQNYDIERFMRGLHNLQEKKSVQISHSELVKCFQELFHHPTTADAPLDETYPKGAYLLPSLHAVH